MENWKIGKLEKWKKEKYYKKLNNIINLNKLVFCSSSRKPFFKMSSSRTRNQRNRVFEKSEHSKSLNGPPLKKLWVNGLTNVMTCLITFFCGRYTTEEITTSLLLFAPIFDELSHLTEAASAEVLMSLVLLVNSQDFIDELTHTRPAWIPVGSFALDTIRDQALRLLKFKIRERIFELNDLEFAKWVMNNWTMPKGVDDFHFKLRNQFWHMYVYLPYSFFSTPGTIPTPIPATSTAATTAATTADTDSASILLTDEAEIDHLFSNGSHHCRYSSFLSSNSFELRRLLVDYGNSVNRHLEFSELKTLLEQIRRIADSYFLNGVWNSPTTPDSLPFITICDDIVAIMRHRIFVEKDIPFTMWCLNGIRAYDRYANGNLRAGEHTLFNFMGVNRKAEFYQEIMAFVIESVL